MKKLLFMLLFAVALYGCADTETPEEASPLDKSVINGAEDVTVAEDAYGVDALITDGPDETKDDDSGEENGEDIDVELTGEVYTWPGYPPDLAAFARLDDYRIIINDAPPVAASDKFIQIIDGLPYVCIRELAEILGYERAVYKDEYQDVNIYTPTPEFFTRGITIGDGAEKGEIRPDAKAKTVAVAAAGKDCVLYNELTADSHILLEAHWEGWYSYLEYPALLIDNDLYIYSDYISWLFQRSFIAESENGIIASQSYDYITPRSEKKLNEWGYDLASPNALLYNCFIGKKDGLCYLLNEEGKQISEAGYECMFFLANIGMLVVYVSSYGNDGGVLDLDGKVVLPMEFASIRRYRNLPYFLVTKELDGEEFFGMYSFKGKCVYPAEYQWLGTAADPFEGYEDESDHPYWMNYFEIDLYPLFDDDRMGAMKNGKWGMVDFKGNAVLPFIYDRIEYTGSLLKVEKDGLSGTVDKNGKFVSPLK